MIDGLTVVTASLIVVAARAARSPDVARRRLDQTVEPHPTPTVRPGRARRVLGVVANRRQHRHRRRLEAEALPAVIDTIAVVVGAGGSVTDALRVLSIDGPPATAPAFAEATRLREAGVALGQTLRRLAVDLHDGFRPVLTTMVAADRDGAPLSFVLARLSEEARNARRIRTETRARQLPVRLIFPLVLCFLSAVIIGAVVPLVFVSFDLIG